MRDYGIETPGTRVKKTSQAMIASRIHVPGATEGGDGIEVMAASEAADDPLER